jgi:hypothetical protein
MQRIGGDGSAKAGSVTVNNLEHVYSPAANHCAVFKLFNPINRATVGVIWIEAALWRTDLAFQSGIVNTDRLQNRISANGIWIAEK